MALESNENRNEIDDIIETLCTSGLKKLDPVLLKRLKDKCIDQEDNLEKCFELLMIELSKQHCEIRYSAFQICDEFFEASSDFRELILDDFQNLIESILDINPNKPLPPPKKTVNELKKLAAITIKKWHEMYGKSYKVLQLGFNYLKNCKKIDFISFDHQTAVQRHHNDQENKKKEILINEQCIKALNELNEKENDIKSCISQINNCFDILIPKPLDLFKESCSYNENSNMDKLPKVQDNTIKIPISHEISNFDSDSDDNDDFVEVKLVDNNEELRYLGFFNDHNSENTRNFVLNLELNLKVDGDNKVIIENIKDFYKELKFGHLDKVNSWIKSISLVKTATNNLKKAIELKNTIQDCLNKFEALGIKLDEPKTNKANKLKTNETNANSLNKKKLSSTISTNNRHSFAPIIDINHMEVGVSVTSKVQANHRYFQRNDCDNIGLESAPSLAKKFYIGEFEPVKWKCRAPINNGKLCERMDRIKCPFHGKIIGRNKVTGDATNPNEETINKKSDSTYAPLGDEQYLQDLERATGKKFTIVKKKKKTGKKHGNLSDLKEIEVNSPRKRLEKKVLSSKSLKKIGSVLDNIESRQNHDKFHHNFNYSLSL